MHAIYESMLVFIRMAKMIDYSFFSPLAYTPVQVEDCKENFLKECHISFSDKAQEVTVDVCTQPLVKNCSRQVLDFRNYLWMNIFICRVLQNARLSTRPHAPPARWSTRWRRMFLIVWWRRRRSVKELEEDTWLMRGAWHGQSPGVSWSRRLLPSTDQTQW